MPTPHGLPATRPREIDEAILGAVTCGLLEGRRLDVAYGSRAQGETMRWELTPLGLVFNGALAYLVCTFWDYPDVRQVALHRVHRAEVLEVPASMPEGFDLGRDIQQEEFPYSLGELWLDSTPIREARQLREVIVSSGSHRSYWTNLRRMIRPLAGVPHDYYPRGRVVFVKAAGRYHVYLGPEIFTHVLLIRQVTDAMCLQCWLLRGHC